MPAAALKGRGIRRVFGGAAAMLVAAQLLAAGQQPAASGGQAPPAAGQAAPPPAGQGGPPRGMRGPIGPEPLAFEDRTGFEPIFDGSSLKGWEGDKAFWRAEGGSIIGEATKENPLKANTFLIYRAAQPANFELKLEYRINSTNSGIQYRSSELPDQGPYELKGYQADIDFANQWTGQLYEERGRGFLALRGQMSHMAAGAAKPRLIGTLRGGDEIKALVKNDDWNTFHVIARGNMLTHILNGQVAAVFIDDDAKNRAMSGLIGFQIHTGPPMKVEYRNIYLKTLP